MADKPHELAEVRLVLTSLLVLAANLNISLVVLAHIFDGPNLGVCAGTKTHNSSSLFVLGLELKQ